VRERLFQGNLSSQREESAHTLVSVAFFFFFLIYFYLINIPSRRDINKVPEFIPLKHYKSFSFRDGQISIKLVFFAIYFIMTIRQKF